MLASWPSPLRIVAITIGYNCIRTPVSEDNLFREALYDRGGSGAAEGAEFDPFGEPILYHEQPYMPVGGTR